jgi:serine/threonine-protein kinase
MNAPDHDTWQRIEEILDRALDAEPTERESVVRAACGDDQALLDRVLTLLSAAEASGPLDTPVHEIAGSLAASAGESLALHAAIEGRVIGAWRVREEIGAGGMGRVFLADRADGAFEQTVALKILRWEVATPTLVDRFLTERQILADLDHPGIARLVDGGVTEEGLPYLAMEFVDGEPIDEYCDRNGLDIRSRLEMFCAAARAVDHAHRNLVVHRDLKPSNILATADGGVKLLDFGVARLVDDTARDDRTQAPVTPRSAAPEQLSGGTITTATDTWALGVLLYELLTGQTPFGGRESKLTETTRRVLEVDPGAPSRVAPESTRRRIAGDLDNIVLKALSKEPERRYSTVERMIEDVRRHLDGMPVLARPATLRYRSGKFIRRHTAPLAAAASVVLLLAGLTGFYTRQLANERDNARQEARKTEEVKGFVLSLFETNDPTLSRGEDISARDLLDAGAERVDTELADQPEIQSEMYTVVAGLYEELGIYDQALALWEKAIPIQRDLEEQELLAETLSRYGFTLNDMGRTEEAKPALREALQLRRERPDDPEAVASSLNQLGMFLAYEGEYEEAAALLRESIEIRETLFEEDTPELAVSMANLGLTVKWNGDFDEAEVHYRRALDIRERTIGRMHPDYAVNLDNLGVLLGQRGDYADSENCFLEALAIRREMLGEEHPDVALSLNNLATLYRVQGRLDEAEPMYRQVLELNTRIFGPEHRRVATNLTNLASVELARGHVPEARELFERSLAIRRASLGNDHIDVAINLNHLAGILCELGDLPRADRYSAEAVEIARSAVGEKSFQLAQCLHIRGDVLFRRGGYGEAREYLEEALAIRQEVLAPDHFETASTQAMLDSTLTRIQR